MRVRESDLDFLSFEIDDADDADESEAGFEPTNCLVVGAVVPKEMLCTIEQQYRHYGVPPVQFIETGDEGQEVFGNADEYAKLMKLPEGVLPTVEEATAWAERERLTSRQW